MTMGLATSICGLVSAGVLANREDRNGGAWSIVGWTALICYAGMLSACMFAQANVFSFTHIGSPTWITTISMLIGLAGMLAGLMTGLMALVALPVLVGTLLYILARTLRRRTTS